MQQQQQPNDQTVYGGKKTNLNHTVSSVQNVIEQCYPGNLQLCAILSFDFTDSIRCAAHCCFTLFIPFSLILVLLLQCSMLVSLCYSLLLRVLCICLFVVVLWVSYGSFYVAQNGLKCFGSVGNRNSRQSYLNSILIDMKMSFLIFHSLFSATFGIVYLFILFESFCSAIWIQNTEKTPILNWN